jgi:hypothetical protein
MDKQALIDRLCSRPGKTGRVHAKCVECIFVERAAGCGNWRQQVEACTSTTCPLWAIRPLSEGEKDEDELCDSPTA